MSEEAVLPGLDIPAQQPLSNVPVTVIVLTWNGIEYTKRCLESLLRNTNLTRRRIVVADNGSTDGTLEYLARTSNVASVAHGRNLGFAQGNNVAIGNCDPDSDIILLNNDTEILQPDWVERLQATAYSSPDIGIVGCRLLNAQGGFLHAGTYMPIETMWGQQIGSNEKEVNQYNQDRDVEGVVFACAYIKRRVLLDVGLLDQNYFSYFADTDYCLRAKEEGYRVVCCGSVTLLHHEHASTTVNQVKREAMFLRAQEVFKTKWDAKLKCHRYRHKLGWHSIFNFPTGYAISSRQFASTLDRLGVDVAYKYVYGPGTPFPVAEPDSADAGYMVNVIRQRKLEASRIQVVYAQGDTFQSNFGRYKIGFTMLETDRIPAEWARQANLMDEVWVPSSFNAETFRASGVTRPIHVMPLGVDPDYFNPRIARYALTGVYTFLSVFEWGERKMPEILLKAFSDEFRHDEPVFLICKTVNSDASVDVRAQVAALKLERMEERIHLSLNDVVPTSQLGALYRSADCFVLPTRGEGWGMPIMEAMACGLPVIATDWSAHRDFMNAENAYPVPVDRLVPAVAKCPYYKGFSWAEPSYHHLRRLMRHVFENQSEARAKGQKASADVLANWTWEQAGRKIIHRIEQIQDRITTHGQFERP